MMASRTWWQNTGGVTNDGKKCGKRWQKDTKDGKRSQNITSTVGSRSNSVAVSTAIGLFSALNRHIAESDPQGSGAHSKGVPWPFLITLVKEVEVLGEMAAVHYRGEENKWGDVAAIEAIR